MALAIKMGVALQGLHPEMLVALQVAEGVYAEYGTQCVVTGAKDGKHGRGSLHYKGYAVDLRTRTVPEVMREAVAGVLRERLGAEFDVVLESDHIHVEFDPKE